MPTSRRVQGKGGWVYEQAASGALKIVTAPAGHKAGSTLTSGAAFDAITKEIGSWPGAFRQVDGAGGWRYEQYADGAIRIVGVPAGQEGSLHNTLRSGKGFEAISREIGAFRVS